MKEVDSVEAEAVVDCFFFLFVIDLVIMVSSNRPVSFLTFGFGKVVVLAFFRREDSGCFVGKPYTVSK